jgi:predicted NAD-dependent protein-ADP-ribosyltransferase YbiA (DUF1768 family)
MAVLSFTKVDLPYGWLGNMAAFPCHYEGTTWRTSEALFQSLRFSDTTIREAIRAEKSPMGAKMKAKSFKEHIVVEPCSPADLDNMWLCIRLKFDQHPVLKDKLLRTGEHEIVEDIGSRNGTRHLFWGSKKVNGVWQGQNNMGKLLMELRDIYKLEQTK